MLMSCHHRKSIDGQFQNENIHKDRIAKARRLYALKKGVIKEKQNIDFLRNKLDYEKRKNELCELHIHNYKTYMNGLENKKYASRQSGKQKYKEYEANAKKLNKSVGVNAFAQEIRANHFGEIDIDDFPCENSFFSDTNPQNRVQYKKYHRCGLGKLRKFNPLKKIFRRKNGVKCIPSKYSLSPCIDSKSNELSIIPNYQPCENLSNSSMYEPVRYQENLQNVDDILGEMERVLNKPSDYGYYTIQEEIKYLADVEVRLKSRLTAIDSERDKIVDQMFHILEATSYKQ